METRSIMPSEPIKQPRITLPGGLQLYGAHPSVFCSTMNTVPATGSLLNKIKLPFAIHIHPYKDMNKQVSFVFLFYFLFKDRCDVLISVSFFFFQMCPVIHPTAIARCRVCRAYINPFVHFVDSRHWKCNLCFRPNACKSST